MNSSHSRRQFLKHSALTAGALALAPGDLLLAQATPKRTAADLVPLGSTGIKLSRLGVARKPSDMHSAGPVRLRLAEQGRKQG